MVIFYIIVSRPFYRHLVNVMLTFDPHLAPSSVCNRHASAILVASFVNFHTASCANYHTDVTIEWMSPPGLDERRALSPTHNACDVTGEGKIKSAETINESAIIKTG